MGLSNLHILAQVTIYVLSLFFSVFVSAPIIVNLTEFNGQCLLYAQGNWNTSNDTSDWQLTVYKWGSSGACNFPIFVGIVSLSYALLYIFLYSVHLYKVTEPSWLVAFVNLFWNSVLTVLTLIAACVTTVGYNEWCEVLSVRYRCDTAEFVAFDEKQGINTSHFNIEFGMAQFGLWTLLASWILEVILASYQMFRFSRHESFFISIQREQARLLGRMSTPNDPTV